jgi:hypothetical protein
VGADFRGSALLLPRHLHVSPAELPDPICQSDPTGWPPSEVYSDRQLEVICDAMLKGLARIACRKVTLH